MIKDNITDWCLQKTNLTSLKRKGPCKIWHTDGMCTKMDINTGEIRHTFMNGYKKEHRVTS